jgi:hypothetical protein
MVKRANQQRRDRRPWYAEGLAFECTQCGACCSGTPGFVWVDPKEIAALSEHMQMSVEAFTKQFVRQVEGHASLVEYPDGDCIFLDPKTRGCSVYEARPIQCRTWPFWNSNLESPREWRTAGEECPGCDQGNVYPLSIIENHRKQKDV